jgi:hypothetical protein
MQTFDSSTYGVKRAMSCHCQQFEIPRQRAVRERGNGFAQECEQLGNSEGFLLQHTRDQSV